MAIHLHIKKQDMHESTLHFMPCKIHGDEEANVSKYFKPYIKKVDEDNLVSSFRGYPLHGKEVSVPEGYKGLTFFEYKKPHNDDEERNIYSTGKFDKFTYWNYDKIPSANDSLISALNWIDIAEALHSPTED